MLFVWQLPGKPCSALRHLRWIEGSQKLVVAHTCQLASQLLHAPCRELLRIVEDLRHSQPSGTAAPLRHARLLMLKAQALAAMPVAGGEELQAGLDAALSLFEQAAARQVTSHQMFTMTDMMHDPIPLKP